MSEGPYPLHRGWRWVRLEDMYKKSRYGYIHSATNQQRGPLLFAFMVGMVFHAPDR